MNKFYLTLGLICLISAPVLSQTSTTGSEIERTTQTETKATTKAVTPSNPAAATIPDELKQVDFSVTPSGISSHTMPLDFPQIVDTGNAEADAADYKARKQQWILDNPAKYEQLQAGANQNGTGTIPASPLVPTKVTK